MLDRRPLGTFATVFYIFSCVMFYVGSDARMWATVLLFAVLVCIFYLKIKIPYKRAVTVIALGMLAASMFSVLTVDVDLAEKQALSGEDRKIVGTVLDVRYTSSWEGCYTVNIDGMKVELTSDNCELKAGDVISCSVLYDGIDPSDDEGRYLLSDGIVLSCETVGNVSVTGSENCAEISLAGLREKLSARLRASMSEEAGGFAAALILGDRSYLSNEIARDFRNLGISHILALSGTHLTMLFSAIGGLLPERRRILRLTVLCPAVVFYMLLTGFSASVVRAGIMFITVLISFAVSRKADGFTSLSVSVFLICILNPYAVFDIGLMLSYGAVIGLIISGEVKRKTADGSNPALFKLTAVLIPAVVVPSVMLPLMWFTFGEVSLISPISNIFIVPVASLFIPVSAILLILSEFPLVFAFLSRVADVLISSFLSGVRYVSEAVDAVLPLNGEVPLLFTVLFAFSAILAVLLSGRYRRVSACLSVILLCVTLALSQFTVYMYNRGMTVCYSAAKSDEAVCVVSGGYNILINMGRYPSALRDAAELGSKYGSDRIDALFLTDLSTSHRLAMSMICSDYYPDSLWLPATEENSELAYSLRQEAERMGLAVYTYIPGERLYFGDCMLLAPSFVNDDRRAVSFSAEYGEERFSYFAGMPADSDGDVAVIGIHGARPSGVLSLYEGDVIVPTSAAISFDTVSAKTLVADSAVIYFSPEQPPSVNISRRGSLR